MRPHRIGMVQAARSTPHRSQHLPLLLLRDLRWRSWHGLICESLDADRASNDTPPLRTVGSPSRTILAIAGAVMRSPPASSTMGARVRERQPERLQPWMEE